MSATDNQDGFASFDDLMLDDIPKDPFGAPAGEYRGLISVLLKTIKTKDGDKPFVVLQFKPTEVLEQVDPEATPADMEKAKLEFMAEYSPEKLSRIRRYMITLGEAAKTNSIKAIAEAVQGAECVFAFKETPKPTDEDPDRKFRNLTKLVMA